MSFVLLVKISFVFTNYVTSWETFQSHSYLEIVNLNHTWKKIIEQFYLLRNGHAKTVFLISSVGIEVEYFI